MKGNKYTPRFRRYNRHSQKLTIGRSYSWEKMVWSSTVPDIAWRGIVSSAMDAIIVCDEAYNIVEFNRSAEEMFGYKSEEVLGSPVYLLLPENLRENHPDYIRQFGETKLNSRHIQSLGILTGQRANGDEFPVEVSISVSEGLGRRFFAAILRDISHRESLEKLILRQYESLDTLHLITLGLLNKREIKELLQFIVDEAAKLLDVSYCEILLPEGDELVAHAYTHEKPFATGTRFNRKTGGLSWRVFETGKPIVLADYSTWPDRHDNYGAEGFRAAAVMPLIVGEECIGVLGITRKIAGYEFSEEEVLIATRLAAIAALAIENSRLYLEIKRLATVDELTGIHNRRSLLAIGEAELDRALRFNRPFSVLMIDVDHFKSINDTWGHAVGDLVLRTVAQESLVRIRKSDSIGRFDESSNVMENVIGRLGGEEFGILLPETPGDRAWLVAERIRHAIEDLDIQIPASATQTIRITVSIGVASLDSASRKLPDLFADADRALYVAKESGRNRVYAAVHRNPAPVQQH